ncbi:MAG: hypothetical protein S4CHLAM102_03820 [Chlamydiia bacterium]|nr:hypothetical protein [Chlamydiia bacterium]
MSNISSPPISDESIKYIGPRPEQWDFDAGILIDSKEVPPQVKLPIDIPSGSETDELFAKEGIHYHEKPPFCSIPQLPGVSNLLKKLLKRRVLPNIDFDAIIELIDACDESLGSQVLLDMFMELKSKELDLELIHLGLMEFLKP